MAEPEDAAVATLVGHVLSAARPENRTHELQKRLFSLVRVAHTTPAACLHLFEPGEESRHLIEAMEVLYIDGASSSSNEYQGFVGNFRGVLDRCFVDLRVARRDVWVRLHKQKEAFFRRAASHKSRACPLAVCVTRQLPPAPCLHAVQAFLRHDVPPRCVVHTSPDVWPLLEAAPRPLRRVRTIAPSRRYA